MTAKKSLALNLVLALTIVLPLASCAPRHLIATRTERLERAPARELAQVTAYNFDWDDNAFFMPTKIVLFNKKTGAEHPVTTGEFAEIRAHVGKDGEWTDYEIRLDDSTGSFRYFREGTQGQNYFLLDAAEGLKDVFDTLRETLKGKKEVVERLNSALEDLEGIREGRKEALARIPEIHANLLTALKGAKAALDELHLRAPTPANKGPSWDALVTALAHPETAAWTTTITARGHPDRQLHEGFELFRALGYFDFLPPKENLYAVSNAKFKGTAANPSEIKAQIMKQLLDRIQALGTNEKMQEVIGPSGKGSRKMHLWGFSDDDMGNIETARKVLSAEMKPSPEYPRGRWPDVKITLFFTAGKDTSKLKPSVVVLTSNGGTRPALAAEVEEAHRLLCAQISELKFTRP